MTRSLNDLDSRARPLFCELIAQAAAEGIPVMIVNVLRNDEEQADNLARGVSATLKSKHLPQLPEGKSLAIDICPYDTFSLHGSDKLKWDTSDPAWAKLGEIGESIGLRWGGRWKKPLDPGHFEFLLEGEHFKDIPVTSVAWSAHGIQGAVDV